VEILEDRVVPDGAIRSGIAVFTPGQANWYIRDSPSPGAPDVSLFPYGGAGWVPVSGDWTGSGSSGIGVFDPATATWYLKNTTGRGIPDVTPFAYGGANWIPIVGDWNGDGKTSIGVFDPSTATWYLKNTNSPGAPDIAPFRYGAPGWLPVVGDWNGDGTTSIGVFDPTTATFYLRNENSPGAPDAGTINYGAAGWLPVAGDWNGNGTSTIGVFDPSTATWYLRNENSPGAPDAGKFAYGGAGWQPLVVPSTAQGGLGAGSQNGPSGSSSSSGGSSSTQQVRLKVPPSVASSSFTATFIVSPVPAGAAGAQVSLDVDLDHNGTFDGSGEQGYASGTLDSSGVAQLDVHGLAPGTYSLRARATVGGQNYTAQATTQLTGTPADHLPMSFEVNQGQTSPQVQYLARTRNATVFLTTGGTMFVSAVGPASSTSGVSGAPPLGGGPSPPGTGSQLEQYNQAIVLAGVNPTVQAVGENLLPGKSNYFLGNNPSQWHRDIPNYKGVEYVNAYPGIDVHYSGSGGDLETAFVVNPGADPSAINLLFPNATRLSINAGGQLVDDTPGGPLVLSPPILSQQINGTTRTVTGSYVLRGSNMVGFHIGSYDSSHALLIDPFLAYGTYLGGSSDENANLNSSVVDDSGNVYIAGWTDSPDFPTTDTAEQPASAGGRDAFVTEIDPTGSTQLFSTYLGGSGDEDPATNGEDLTTTGVAVDGSGNVYLAGTTNSTDFPTVNPEQDANAGGVDLFVSSLTADGSALNYSTYLGGSGGDGDQGVGIAVDDSGSAYVTGNTASDDFPTTAGVIQDTLNGTTDAFVTKFDADGANLAYSTYLGGSGDDSGHAIAVDGGGNAYVVGTTTSDDFPTTGGVVQGNFGGGEDAFVTEVDSTGTGKVYSTYLGGTGDDEALAIVLDGAGDAFVGGRTTGDFPITTGAFQTTFGGGNDDGWITELDPGATKKFFSTYVGGSGDEFVRAIALDSVGDVYVTGQTDSADLPILNPAQAGLNGPSDAFVIGLNKTGATQIFGTYLGGSGDDAGGGIGLDSSDNIYVTGQTLSDDFPTTDGAFQTGSGGAADAFVAKIAADVAFPEGIPGEVVGVGSAVNPGPDRFEPNDTSDVATDMGRVADSETFTDLSIDHHANGLFDQDWYKWSIKNAGTFDASLVNIKANGGDLHLRVFVLNPDDTLTELGNSTLVGGVKTQRVAVNVNAGDEIYVWVFGFNNEVGTYDMTIKFS
jgi:hypothetical protein